MRRTQIAGLLVVLLGVSLCWAVRARYQTHQSEGDFKDGKMEGVILSSTGSLSLGYAHRSLIADGNDVWSVNQMIEGPAGGVYAATSGKGRIYKYAEGELSVFFEANEKQPQHFFSLVFDGAGDLWAGSGGNEAHLCRFDANGVYESVFSDPNISYIWAMATDAVGDVFYLATGPEGKLLSFDRTTQLAVELFDCKQSNLISLAASASGDLYVGTDEEGIIYKVNPKTREFTVVYDSDYKEISSLLLDGEGNVYACTADVGAAQGAEGLLSSGQKGRPVDEEKDKENDAGDSEPPQEPTKPIEPDAPEGEPSVPGEEDEDAVSDSSLEGDEDSEQAADETMAEDGEGLAQAFYTAKAPMDDEEELRLPLQMAVGLGLVSGDRQSGRAGGPQEANALFKITPAGFVERLFAKDMLFLDMAFDGRGHVLLATGHQGKLLRFNLADHKAAIVYQAKQSNELVSIFVSRGGGVYLGGANPGEVIEVQDRYVAQGTYDSKVLDAGQVSRWGQVQIEAAVPSGSSVMIQGRTGNIADAEQAGWHAWSEAATVSESVALDLPAGRFLQYRLLFGSDSGEQSAAVNEVKFVYLTANLPPRLTHVEVVSGERDGMPAGGERSDVPVMKNPVRTVRWIAEDDNGDTLQYEVFLRPLGSERWVRVAKELRESQWRWDTVTVEDGRYEVKVEVTDRLDNLAETAFRGQRVSEPVLVDNSSPVVEEMTWRAEGQRVTMAFTVRDALSLITSVSYAVNSAKEWQMLLPADELFDSRTERFRTQVDLTEPGSHWITVRIGDAANNVTYRNLMVEIQP